MTETETTRSRRFLWPADYYSGPSPVTVLPRGVTFGCGAASALVVVLLLAGGAMMSGGGFTDVMDFVIGMTVGEMKGMYAADVPDAQKKELDAEVTRMRENFREGRVPLPALQPFLEEVRKASADRRVNAEETSALLESVRKVNATKKSVSHAAP